MAINVKNGRWGLTRIIQLADGCFTTSAMVAGIAQGIEPHYPPMNATKTGFVLPVALIRCLGTVNNTDPDTVLIPRAIDISELTLGDLTPTQRTNLRNALLTRLAAYDFTDWDGTLKQISAFTDASYTLATPLRQIARDIFSHLSNSDYRPKPSPLESHNTEYTDNFTTDPATTGWVGVSGGTFTHDAVNNEMDCTTSVSRGAVYYPTDPGSIEHEAQATFNLNGRASRDVIGGGCGRIHGTNDDFYFPTANNQSGNLVIYRHTAGAVTTLATYTGYSTTRDEFLTMRSAYSGGSGSNVVIDLWYQNHGSTKPSDPGWIGTDGSPDHSYTDTSADRLDDSTHIYCGVGWYGTGDDYDTQHDFFKERAISDRGGGGGGAITGTVSLAFTPVGVLAGTGNMAGTANAAFTSAGVLTGTGTLIGNVPIVFVQTGGLTGTGSFTATVPITLTVSGTMAGSGALSGIVSTVFGLTGVLSSSGSGAIVGTVTPVFGVTGVLTGTGGLASVISGVFSTGFTLTGTAPISASITNNFSATGVLTGTGAIAGVVSSTFSLAGTFDLNGINGQITPSFTLAGQLTGTGNLPGNVLFTFATDGTLITITAAGWSEDGGLVTIWDKEAEATTGWTEETSVVNSWD